MNKNLWCQVYFNINGHREDILGSMEINSVYLEQLCLDMDLGWIWNKLSPKGKVSICVKISDQAEGRGSPGYPEPLTFAYQSESGFK